jgi:hypothetical protein
MLIEKNRKMRLAVAKKTIAALQTLEDDERLLE